MKKSRLIYVSQFLSTWGDRMWSFAVSLFLMDLAPDSLLLPAIFGLVRAATVLMFAPLVGNWIDKTARLRGAQIPLVIQNSSVAVCAAILLVQKLKEGESGGFKLFVKIAAVALGSLAQLASTATTIVIQKDWIVVIADGDSTLLSRLNSMLRRIDLFTKLLAPLVCGQVMTLASLTVGCGFVAGWNILSMVVEYILLRMVYVRTPALADKRGVGQSSVSSNENRLELNDLSQEEEGALVEMEESIDSEKDDVLVINDTELQSNRTEEENKNMSCFRNMFSFILVIPQGWKLYMSQTITKAGIGLSCLYMTVLGFDAITISYAYNQCFSELMVGILVGCSAITGIIATFMFPPLSARFGVLRTGSIASIAQVLTLIPCILAAFAPGSPFFLISSKADFLVPMPTINSTPLPTVTELTTTSSYVTMGITYLNESAFVMGNYSYSTNRSDSDNGGVFIKCIEGISPPSSYVSLSLLMTGTILARIGLWGFDLAITQLFQQQVLEQERGIVSGVQSSLNNLMDLVHFIFVISLPSPEQFGILILLSAFFVSLGHFLYALFSKQQSGSFCFGK